MKKLNKKVLFGLFSLLDLIIIMLIMIIAGICYKFIGGDNSSTTNSTITYIVEVVEVEKNITESVKANDILFDAKNNNEVGKVIDTDTTPSYRYVYDYKNKIYKKDDIEDKKNLYIKIESKVYETESNLLIGNLDIKVGSDISFKGKGYYINGKIYSIDR